MILNKPDPFTFHLCNIEWDGVLESNKNKQLVHVNALIVALQTLYPDSSLYHLSRIKHNVQSKEGLCDCKSYSFQVNKQGFYVLSPCALTA